MQTFLPLPTYTASAQTLDRQRLGNQRREVIQLLRALLGLSKGWRNHPAALMWKGHEVQLAAYGLVICNEWTSRGYRDTCAGKIESLASRASSDASAPGWLGSPAFHAAHRSALLAKDPEWYGRFGWSEAPRVEYVCPVEETK